MAGRGRGSVLPAWMTEAAAAEAPAVSAPSVPSTTVNGQFNDTQYSAPPPAPQSAVYRAPPASIPGYGAPAPNPAYRAPPPPVSVSAPIQSYTAPPAAAPNSDVNRDSNRRDRSRSREREPHREASPPREGDSKKSKKNWRGSRPAPTKSNWDIGPNGQFTPQNMNAHLMASHSAAPPPPTNRGGGGGGGDALNDSKHARKLYVGGIPAGTTDDDIAAFFSDVFAKCAPAQYMQQGNPILSVHMHHEKCFAFVEFNTIELTSACLLLDGAPFPNKSVQCVIRLRRPKDYRPEAVPEISRTFPPLNLSCLGVVATSVVDGPNKIFIGGLPNTLNEEQIKELLCTFGPLRAFHLVKDPGATLSKGYAFFEYVDHALTPLAVEGLHGLQVLDKTVTVKVNANSTAAAAAVVAAAAALKPAFTLHPSYTFCIYSLQFIIILILILFLFYCM